MGFNKIKSVDKKVVSIGPISTLYGEALEITRIHENTHDPILRPSGFPICPILNLIKFHEFSANRHIKQEEALHSDFFTSVGTTTHEVVQKWMGKTGRLLGDWSCSNTKCERYGCVSDECSVKGCTDETHFKKVRKVGHVCSKCGEELTYHEIEVEHSIVTGHVDSIVRMPSGNFWACDYKTLSVKKYAEIKEPSVNYLYQIRSYAYILDSHYDIPIEGYSIFYITRDNPGAFKEFSYTYSTSESKKAFSIVEHEITKYRAALKAFKSGDIDIAIELKPCRSKEHYEQMMGPYCKCPLADVCFSGKAKLRKQINANLKQFVL